MCCVCVCQLSCIKNAKLYHVSIIPKMLCGVRCVRVRDHGDHLCEICDQVLCSLIKFFTVQGGGSGGL